MFSTSPNGILFLEDSESVVLVAYPDVGGVITIGGGLTELSPAFRKLWRAEHNGKPLRKGDKVTLGDARRYMKATLAGEFEPATRTLAPQAQHVFDGEVSVLWNCGTGATKWKWAQALKAGRITEGCKLLLTTAVTSAGKPYRGLQLRRRREARLIEFADYGRAVGGVASTKGRTATDNDEATVKGYQGQLAKLGLYKGTIDGKHVVGAKGDLTDGAVRNFQRANGLRVDGVVGPATRSALARAVRAKDQATTVVGGPVATSGATGIGLQLDAGTLLTVAGITLAVLVVGFLIWNNRGRILGVRTPA
jgi:lysozyme